VTFLWPAMLLALLAVPLGAWTHARIGARRQRRAAAYGGLALATAVPRGAAGFRRRAPAVLLAVGCTLLALALARPQAVLSLPRLEGIVMLAFDVSGSMAATDFEPTRMEAAKVAARAFVERQPIGVVVGVVSFSDSGFSVQAPTSDRDAVIAAIDRLGPEQGTSLATGIRSALNAIALAESGPSTNYYSNRSPEPAPAPTPVPAGTYAPAVIVLLSDGENTDGSDPLEAARAAADRGVRIHTVAIGSTEGVTLEVNGFRVHTQRDDAMLQAIAATTGGDAYEAGDQAALETIYGNLDTRLVVAPEAIEVTSLLAGAGLIVLVLGAAASLRWLGRWP
jgi:Ca-activated chloride channel family protein